MRARLTFAIIAITVLVGGAAAPIAAADPGTIGVIGCSNTVQATAAYLEASTDDQLAQTARWGTSLGQWASPRNQRFWETYDTLRPATGYTATWLNLCARVSKRTGEPQLTQTHVDAVLVKIWDRDPGIPVFINPLNFFTDEGCPTSGGNTVPVIGAALADATAAANPLVERIPDLGPIEGNPCHLDPSDQELVGSQLVAIFDQ